MSSGREPCFDRDVRFALKDMLQTLTSGRGYLQE
jgi:hypothetical protein